MDSTRQSVERLLHAQAKLAVGREIALDRVLRIAASAGEQREVVVRLDEQEHAVDAPYFDLLHLSVIDRACEAFDESSRCGVWAQV